MDRKQFWALGSVVLVGVLVSIGILFSGRGVSSSIDSHGHENEHDHDGESSKGPHGGKLLSRGPFELELVIYEKGGPPHFRIYPSMGHKPLDPTQVAASVEIKRIGDRISNFEFKPLQDFLICEQELDEPHSFDVKVSAQWNDERFDWEFAQYEGRLTIPSEIIDKMAVQSTEAGPKNLETYMTLPGEIALNTDKVSRIVPRVSGLILDTTKNLGDTVSKDEIIAIIDSRELGEAKSAYLVALEREKLARYNFERSQQLWEKETVPEKEFLTAKKTYLEEKIGLTAATRKLFAMGLKEQEILDLEKGSLSELTHYPIRAAFEGTVVKKRLSKGEWLKDDSEIFVIADLSTVWVEISVYPNDLERVHIGQKAVVKSASSNLESTGEVSYVGSVVGEDSRTAKARVVISNTEGKWRPGLFVKVKLLTDQSDVPVAVKAEAIHSFQNRSMIFVKYGAQFEARPLDLGRTDGQYTEVIKGLSAGENYLFRNSFILKSELGKAGMSHQH